MDKPKYKNDALRSEAYRVFSHCDFRTIGEHNIANLGVSSQSKLYCMYKKMEDAGLTTEFIDQKDRYDTLKFGRYRVIPFIYERYFILKRYFDAYKLEEGLKLKPEAQNTKVKRVKI